MEFKTGILRNISLTARDISADKSAGNVSLAMAGESKSINTNNAAVTARIDHKN